MGNMTFSCVADLSVVRKSGRVHPGCFVFLKTTLRALSESTRGSSRVKPVQILGLNALRTGGRYSRLLALQFAAYVLLAQKSTCENSTHPCVIFAFWYRTSTSRVLCTSLILGCAFQCQIHMGCFIYIPPKNVVSSVVVNT